jgi:hypothetical protein
VSDKFDYEAELAVVIGTRVPRHVSQATRCSYVFGYTCFNDMSVRDFQKRTPQWTIGKNFDGTGGFGPVLVTADELPPGAAGLRICSRLNGQVMQDANTSDMIFARRRDHCAAGAVPDAGTRRRDHHGHARRRGPGAHAAGVDEGRRHDRDRDRAHRRAAQPHRRRRLTPHVVDVAIVGCGPTGVVAAGLLGRPGCRSTCATARRTSYEIPRAIALDHEMMRVFQQLGVADAVLRRTEPFTPSEYFGVDGQLIRRMTMVAPPYPQGHTPSPGVHAAGGGTRAACAPGHPAWREPAAGRGLHRAGAGRRRRHADGERPARAIALRHRL